MPRDFKLYLSDILRSVERINRLLASLDEAAFKKNDVAVDGILFNLLTIGEAVKNVPEDVLKHLPEARWREMARFRDRVVHHYFSLDLNIVWEIVTVHVPILKTNVETLLQDIEAGGSSQE